MYDTHPSYCMSVCGTEDNNVSSMSMGGMSGIDDITEVDSKEWSMSHPMETVWSQYRNYVSVFVVLCTVPIKQ